MLYKHRCRLEEVRKHFFAQIIVNDWDALAAISRGCTTHEYIQTATGRILPTYGHVKAPLIRPLLSGFDIQDSSIAATSYFESRCTFLDHPV